MLKKKKKKKINRNQHHREQAHTHPQHLHLPTSLWWNRGVCVYVCVFDYALVCVCVCVSRQNLSKETGLRWDTFIFPFSLSFKPLVGQTVALHSTKELTFLCLCECVEAGLHQPCVRSGTANVLSLWNINGARERPCSRAFLRSTTVRGAPDPFSFLCLCHILLLTQSAGMQPSPPVRLENAISYSDGNLNKMEWREKRSRGEGDTGGRDFTRLLWCRDVQSVFREDQIF